MTEWKQDPNERDHANKRSIIARAECPRNLGKVQRLNDQAESSPE
jgi:hypothetical protein